MRRQNEIRALINVHSLFLFCLSTKESLMMLRDSQLKVLLSSEKLKENLKKEEKINLSRKQE